jgi:hypothetical protein
MDPFASTAWMASAALNQPTFPSRQAQPIQHNVTCPLCAQQHPAETAQCWRCLHIFPTHQNQFANTAPLYTPPPPSIPPTHPTIPTYQSSAIPIQDSPLDLMQKILAYQKQANAIPISQQQLQTPKLSSQPSYVFDSGSPSNPITIGDSPPLERTVLANPPPIAPLPGGWPAGGWPPNPFLQPHISHQQRLLLAQDMARRQHLYQPQPVPAPLAQNAPYDQYYGAPSTDEIKELLANIRPDEEIEIEDKDAIVEGLAKNTRLMKHQQVHFLPFPSLMVDGRRVDAKDGRREE